jgi:hypothetical protein
MAHLPVNHPARTVLRVMTCLIGLYILVFGIAGLVRTWGEPFFSQGPTWVLGLRTNPAFSVLSILAGAVILGGALFGRNVDHFINLWGGVAFLVAGTVMMAVLNTTLNLLNFAITNTVVSFVIGLLLMLAGLYGKVGPPDLEEAEDKLRHGEVGETQPEAAGGAAAEVEARTDITQPPTDRPSGDGDR